MVPAGPCVQCPPVVSSSGSRLFTSRLLSAVALSRDQEFISLLGVEKLGNRIVLFFWFFAGWGWGRTAVLVFWVF